MTLFTATRLYFLTPSSFQFSRRQVPYHWEAQIKKWGARKCSRRSQLPQFLCPTRGHSAFRSPAGTIGLRTQKSSHLIPNEILIHECRESTWKRSKINQRTSSTGCVGRLNSGLTEGPQEGTPWGLKRGSSRQIRLSDSAESP